MERGLKYLKRIIGLKGNEKEKGEKEEFLGKKVKLKSKLRTDSNQRWMMHMLNTTEPTAIPYAVSPNNNKTINIPNP